MAAFIGGETKRYLNDELAPLPRAADRRGEEVPGAVRHAAREPPRHRRARPLLARHLRAAGSQQYVPGPTLSI